MALTIIVTNAGRAALVNAANTGTAPVTIAQVGFSATALAPSPAAVALPGEFKRLATLSGDVIADDTIHLIVRDEGLDVFTVRSLALYLADGTLFAIYGQADVLVEKSAQSTLLLAIDVQFADVDATDLTFGDTNFLNPPATTEIAGVVELSTDAEAIAGTDAQRAVTPKGMAAAVTSWLNTRFGVGAPSAFVKGLLVAASAIAFRAALEIKGAALKDEGAGNTLDADLLDGQHGSYYGNIPDRLGYTPWGPSNDGSGSGLDADLLDGQDGSYYTNIVVRLGYTPANKAGDTFSGAIRRDSGFYMDLSGGKPMLFFADDGGGADRIEFDRATNTFIFNLGGVEVGKLSANGLNVLSGDILIGRTGMAWGYLIRPNVAGYKNLQFAVEGGGSLDNLEMNSLSVTIRGNAVWHSGNDGAGSGLDADLLDGQDSSYYSNIVARLGYTPLQQGGGTGQLTNKVYIGWSGSRLKAQVDVTDLGNVVFDGHIADVWRSSNDGSGSGLDADLLDGFQASDFQRVVASNMIANGGYRVFADGTKETWGSITIGQDQYGTYNLPTGHSSWVHPNFGLSTAGGNVSIQQNTGITSINGSPPTSITFWNADDRVVTIWVRTIGV